MSFANFYDYLYPLFKDKFMDIRYKQAKKDQMNDFQF